MTMLRRRWRHWLATQRAAPFAQARLRLTLTYALFGGLLVAALATVVYASDAHARAVQVDQQLQASASPRIVHGVSDVLAHGGVVNGPTIDHDGDYGLHYSPTSPNVFTIAADGTGVVFFNPDRVTDPSLLDAKAAQKVIAGQTSSLFTTTQHGDHQYRLYTVPLTTSQGQIIGIMQAGISLDSYWQGMHDLLLTLVLVGLGTLVVISVAGYFLAERALAPAQQAYARQRQFVAAASHELRTPLALLRSQAELVTRHLRRADATLAESVAPDMDEMMTEIDSMTRLVSDMLLLARDAHAIPAVPQEVDLAATARQVVEKLQPVAQANAQTVRFVQEDDDMPALIAGDADRVRQLLVILVDNAIRYTPPKGEIIVSVGDDPTRRDSVRLVVQDTGIGIAPEHQARIFEPFYRVDPARTRSDGQQSVGLGLALARWITDTLGGTISVTSRPDQGSAFSVRLPKADLTTQDPVSRKLPAAYPAESV